MRGCPHGDLVTTKENSILTEVLTAAMPYLVGFAGALGGLVAAVIADMLAGGVVSLVGGDPDQVLAWEWILFPLFALVGLIGGPLVALRIRRRYRRNRAVEAAT